MLSICIPIFNQDVSTLAAELHRQAAGLGAPVELLLLDDGSDEPTKAKNRKLKSLPLVRYEELPENIGRSRMRNELAGRSAFPFLLFIDCDMEVTSGEYLQQYIRHMAPGTVVCGGHHYSKEQPGRPWLLHWLVGSVREVRPAEKRRERPYHSFMTANFLIDRELMSRIGFREELDGYGHEDTLMGYRLKKAGIPVLHIDNPLIHNGLEPAPLFLEKTRESLENLWKSYKLTGKDPEYAHMVTILRAYLTLKKWGFAKLFGKFSGLLTGPAERHLKGKSPGLRLFDLYKLCVLCRVAD
ncbi:MAG: glycosyltransferase family 2 protein [Bacteroidales bacterium]